MKKLTRRGFTAAGIIAALSAGLTNLTGCDFDLMGCSRGNLYGPPPELDPDDNEPVAVYGPPEWFEDDDVVEDDGDDTENDYDAEDNLIVGVYGPPEDYEGDEYDPDDNMVQLMYGPMQVYDPDDAD